MTSRERDTLHALLSAVVDGTIGQEQAAELARLLAADAEARRFYVRYLDMHAALAEVARRPEAPVRRRLPWVAIVATLMAASLLLALLIAPFGRRVGRPVATAPERLAVNSAVSSGYVATITAVSGDAVLNGEPAVGGMRLTPGVYELSVGSLTIQFDGGARVLFEGRPRFTLRSRRTMSIERGTFVFEGDRLCESIEIVTPHSVFRNLGTRYAAVIGPEAEEVHVSEGAVRRTPAGPVRPARHELIEAGAGRRFGGQQIASEAIPLDEMLVAKPLGGPSSAAADDAATVSDDFDVGGDQVRGMQSGLGWAEPWRSRRGELRLVSSGPAGEGAVAVVHDGAGDELPRSRSAAHRAFAKPIDLSEDGVWYLRFLVRRGPRPAKDDHRAMVVLRKRGLTPDEEVEHANLIQIALRGDDIVMVRLADTLSRASLPQVPDQTYAVVAKIVAGRVKPEQVLIRLMAFDRLAGSEEPAEWSLVSESVDTDIWFDQLSLECTSEGRIEFSGLRIGPTWESVTGPAVDH